LLHGVKVLHARLFPFTIAGKYLCNMEWIFELADIDRVANQLLTAYSDKKVWALDGGMGAGKTTLVHALCGALGVVDMVSSPTFPVINEYSTADGQTVYHIDLYRLKDAEEAINTGVEDCLYSGHRCFVEWPGRANELFDGETLHLQLVVVNGDRRKLTVG
jgi:tRNA threonylcarbamoyladenosine biosynthesis protein TsaE